MTVFGLYRHAVTRPLMALSFLGFGWSLGCSSDGTNVPPPVVGSAGSAGAAGASASGGGSNVGGSSQSGGQAGTTGNSGGTSGDSSVSGGSSGDNGAAGDATAGGQNAGGTAGDAGSSGAGTGGSAGSSGANSGGTNAGGTNAGGNNSGGNNSGGNSSAGNSSAGNNSGGTNAGGTNSGGNNSGGSGGNLPTLCGKTLQASGATELTISSASDDSFGGISSDERAIAWTTVANGTVTLWYADRASETSAFDAPKSLVIAAAADQVSISSDGLQIAFVDADRLGFSELTRGGVGDTFASAGSGDFAAFAAATAMLPAGESYGDPLLVSNGDLFYYSRFGAGRTQTLFLTSRFSSFDPWLPGGQATLPAAVQGSGANRFHPSGVSGDGYTLFGWSDATNSELALSLNQQTSAFDTYTDLGARRNAAPNQDCTRLYYSAPGTGGMDLFVASVQ
ncbi:MAG TPA: hypothetical protein VGI10_10375 [Polyangiaceae bacterium]|jgi:hypothetical protein